MTEDDIGRTPSSPDKPQALGVVRRRDVVEKYLGDMSPDEPRTLGIREKSYGMRFRVRSLSQDESLALDRSSGFAVPS